MLWHLIMNQIQHFLLLLEHLLNRLIMKMLTNVLNQMYFMYLIPNNEFQVQEKMMPYVIHKAD